KQSWNRFLWNAGIKYNSKIGICPFVNAGSSFMAPGLKSIGGTILLADQGVPGMNGQLPNPDLKPESGLGIDAGIDFRIKESGMFTIRGFLNEVDDAIIDNVVSQDPSQTQSINAGKTTSKGLEFSLNYKFSEMIEAFANFTLLDTKITNKIDTTQDGAQIPFVPDKVTNLGFSLNLPYRIKAVAYVHVAGKMYDSSNKYGRAAFTAHETVNVHVSKDFKFGKKVFLSCFLNLYNITNNKYLMPWQFQDPGFSFMGGVSVGF
ncbi:MAG: TonB-dependent receptor, partial [Bacteroidales bacterium]